MKPFKMPYLRKGDTVARVTKRMLLARVYTDLQIVKTLQKYFPNRMNDIRVPRTYRCRINRGIVQKIQLTEPLVEIKE